MGNCTCSGKCLKLRHIKSRRDYMVSKYCSQCEWWVKRTEAVYCECCSQRLKGNSSNQKYARKKEIASEKPVYIHRY